MGGVVRDNDDPLTVEVTLALGAAPFVIEAQVARGPIGELTDWRRATLIEAQMIEEVLRERLPWRTYEALYWIIAEQMGLSSDA